MVAPGVAANLVAKTQFFCEASMKKERGGAAVAILVILLLVGAAVYYFYFHKKEKQEPAPQQEQEQATQQKDPNAEPKMHERIKKGYGDKLKKRMVEVPE